MRKIIIIPLLLLILTLAISPFSSAIRTETWDSYAQSFGNCDSHSCGDKTDRITWIGESISFQIVNSASNDDILCADIDDDGDYDTCVYETLTKYNDCKSSYSSELNSISSNNLFHCVGDDLEDCGWGFYHNDPTSASLSGNFIICGGSSCSGIDEVYDSNNNLNDVVDFKVFQDCDDSSSQNDTDDMPSHEFYVIDKKATFCAVAGYGGTLAIKGYYSTFGTKELDNPFAECSFIDPDFGEDLMLCDVNELQNSTVYDFNFNSSLACYYDSDKFFSLRDNVRNVCADGKLYNSTNETFIDYGGICGNCSFNVSDPEQDLVWAIARELFEQTEGTLSFNNPFNESYCPVAEPTVSTPIFFFLIFLVFVLIFLILLFGILGFILIFLGAFVGRKIWGFTVKKTKKYLNNKK